MEYFDEYSFARPYLNAGETVLWKGKPGKGHLLTRYDAYTIPFSILWCSGAVYGTIPIFTSNVPLLLRLWALLFIGLGLYLLVGRFFWTAYVRRHTAYVITTRSIIRCRRGKIESLSADAMPPMYVTVHKDGSGSIRFGQGRYYRRRRASLNFEGDLFSLENIPDVLRVQRIVENMER